jgi:hypothetical protein
MTMIDGGKVGIGTSSPTAKLEVNTIDQNTGNAEIKLRGGTPRLILDKTGTVDACLIDFDQDLAFRTFSGGNEKLRILSGGGITFNGDTASANALDDYEEGTWTPTIVGGGAATLNNVSSTYTKIGNRVMITCYINIYPNSDSNDFKLGGLPYTNKSNSWGASPVNTTGNNHPNVCVRAQGHTGTILDFKNHETDSAFNFNDWGNGAHLVFQLQYPIA